MPELNREYLAEQVRHWLNQVTPIPKPVDPDEEDRSESCYIPKTTVADMRDFLKLVESDG